MPYRVPKSRLLPPRTAREVERWRLLERLRQGFAKSPVLVLAAGAGYGKSTLLSSLPALWLTLGEDCSDPVVLGWHLVEVYRPRLGNGLDKAVGALERGAWAVAGELMLERLSEQTGHTLVLDEAQRAASREAVALLRTLAQVPGLHIAVLTRRAAPWEVLGQVLGESELAFDSPEALQLGQAVAPELSAFEVEQAHSLVRGWPLGLRLLLRAMQRGARPEEAFYAHPDPAGLLAYLLPTLPDQVRNLAARASVLGDVGPEEAAWVGELEMLQPYAPDLLLEQVGGRIRFHPLVRAALMSLLEPGEVRGLLAKAADLALERGEEVQAAGYLLEAGRLGHAADLLQRQGEAWLARGLTYTVLALLERLPEAMRATRPHLCFLHGEALRQAGRYGEAQRVYQQALQAGVDQALLGLSRLYLDTVEPAKAQGYLLAAQLRFPKEVEPLWAENLLNAGRAGEARALGLQGPRVWLRSGQPERALAELRRSEGDSTARAPRNHREGTLLLALLEAIAGDAGLAEQAAYRGRREGEMLGSPFVVALAEARLGHALLAQNRWAEAGDAYQRALSLSQGGPARLQVEPLGGLAALGEARAFEEMVRQAREAGDAWVEAFMTLVAAQAHLRRGQPFNLPALPGLEDPFLRALAANYPWEADRQALLVQCPFLCQPTLFAPPLERSRRLLWEAGKLDLPYHPGVGVEVRARGRFQVWVNHQEVRFRREKVRTLLALLLIRDWSKEALMEALEVSDGEFRVLWSELLSTLEPGRPPRTPGYFLRPYALCKVPELRVDLWESTPSKAWPFEGLDHPVLERYRTAWLQDLLRACRQSNSPEEWLWGLRLDPLDEDLLARLEHSELAAEARRIRQEALKELELDSG